ncbi:hypothetical protein DICPUDRAFT_35027 [Dictyostelium purpureum]|uniref:Sodium/calcium exchanger membrane region domain-containing protein n=1 Tax=Dictyostelium purpureum TaxID=5786 RepID=F0ZNP0_DICPU|nr:uncharacterized protein DICPUDRAFT_35027 [Dictyostelium purpureum]EGC34455.1 hypothetical protein DICPUDRAFT_35027 [Dictyostelium purpureum]|eukprot:XP_003289040.1 hypothetical protein DICPUDRAFT_35027 [Dictyostelium purpureum]
MIPVLTAFLSFIFLSFASWCIGEGGEILGKKYDASIIGGLIIAWLNTAPEAIFFITALSSDNTRFAVGAVSGSSIVVCTVALGCCIVLGTRKRKAGTVQLQPPVKRQCLILLCSIIIPLAILLTGYNIFFGCIGVLYYVVFIGYSLFHKLPEDEKKEDDIEMGINQNGADPNSTDNNKEEEDHEEEEEEHDEPLYKGVFYLFLGGLLICYFSKPFIDSIVSLASSWEVNPILLAFFLAPIASEMPEILESISLSRKGNSQSINIAFSNLIGGTITKTTLLMGIFCFFGVVKGFEWESPTYSLSLLLLTICAASAAGIGYFVPKIKQTHGLLLFAIFSVTGIIQYCYNINIDDAIAAV